LRDKYAVPGITSLLNSRQDLEEYVKKFKKGKLFI